MASASPQTVTVPERPAERVESPASSRPVSPESRPQETPFVVKLMGGIPT